jgi:hypothetical protein
MPQDILWLQLALGAILGLTGWLIYWGGLKLIGGFLGAIGGWSLGILAIDGFDLQDHALLVQIGAAVLLAILGVLVITKLQLLLFFVIGAILGAPALLQLRTSPILEGQAWAQGTLGAIGLTVVGAWAGGTIVLAMRRYVIALVSSIFGSMLVMTSLPLGESEKVFVWLGGFAVCMVAQVILIRRYLPDDCLRRISTRKWTDAPKA